MILNDNIVKVTSYIAEKGRINVPEIVATTGVSISTVYYYLKKYFGIGKPFRLVALTNPQRLGLRSALLLLKSVNGRLLSRLLERELFDMWNYYARIYGCGVWEFFRFLIPAGREYQLMKFLDEAMEKELIRNYRLKWLIGPHSVKWNFEWYENGKWVFRWDEWVREVEKLNDELPSILTDNNIIMVKLDNIDLEILKRLEVNMALLKYTDIARNLNVGEHIVKYHYKNHLRNRELYSFKFIAQPLIFGDYDIYILELEFPDDSSMGRFVRSLDDKPFGITAYRVVDISQKLDNKLIISVCLPSKEVLGLFKALNELMNSGIITSFNYYLVDKATAKRYTLPYNYLDLRVGVHS